MRRAGARGPDGVLGRDDELDRSSSLTGLDPGALPGDIAPSPSRVLRNSSGHNLFPRTRIWPRPNATTWDGRDAGSTRS